MGRPLPLREGALTLTDSDAPKPIRVGELSPGDRFGRPLFHRDGTLLLLANAAVDATLVRALASAGIDEVFLCESEAATRALRTREGLTEVDAGALPEGRPVDRNLYNQDGELVCARGQPFTDTLLGSLARRGEVKLFQEGSFYEAVRERFEEALAREVTDTLERRIDEDVSILRVSPGALLGGEAFVETCRHPSPSERTRAGIEKERRRHASLLASTNGLLERARREGTLDLPAAQDIVIELLERTEQDLPLTLALAETALHHDYLVDHSLAVATHALAMGLALGYERAQCSELALGALLHDIGMTRVSERILDKRGPLGPEELAEIRSHPQAGVELLKKTPGAGFPLPFAVYQDHERADGRGYPRGSVDGWIHDYAKIIAVADVYQAMTAPRPYKPRRRPHRAVLRLLGMVQEDVLDAVACRAFLLVHGVFPVGSWVRLTDGRVARVVDASEKSYDRPVVTVVGAADGSPLDGPETMDLSTQPEPGVLEDLDAESVQFDFTAGLHIEAAAAEARHVPPTAGAGGARRTVPAEFLDWSASFSGYLSDFGVLDLVRILDVSQKSGVLALRFPDAVGIVRFSEGEIMGAELHPPDGEAERDEEAIYEMIQKKEGTFRFEQCAVDRKKTVKLGNTMILMEACRRMDERARG